MWPEHGKLQKRSRKLQRFDDKLAQRRKTRASCPKRNAQARIEIEKLQTELEDDGQKIKAETLNEAELDLEVRALREGEGRRGSNGCCFDLAILEQFIAMGAEWAKQQFAIFRSELDRVDVQHQPRRRQHTKCPESRRERSNQPRQEQEKVGTRSRASQRTVSVGTQRHGGVATEVFQLVLFLIPLCSQIMVQEATEMNVTRQGEVRNTEADGQQQKETIRQQRQDLGRHMGEV